MKFEEFTKKVMDEILQRIEGKGSVSLEKNTKNNGVERTGMLIQMDGKRVSPYIYLEHYYEGYENGAVTFSQVMDEIAGAMDGMDSIEHALDIEGFFCWEKIKCHIHAKLVNRGMNKAILEDSPNRDFLDLSVLYYVKMGGLSNGAGTILVKDWHLKTWGKTEEDLYDTALGNMKADGEIQVHVLTDLLLESFPEMSKEEVSETRNQIPELYVLTNRDKLYGASAMLDSKVLENVGDKFGSDILILPSSIHELILYPAFEKSDVQPLAKMVAEINQKELAIEERLSDHVYQYSREKKKAEIVA